MQLITTFSTTIRTEVVVVATHLMNMGLKEVVVVRMEDCIHVLGDGTQRRWDGWLLRVVEFSMAASPLPFIFLLFLHCVLLVLRLFFILVSE